MKYTYSDLCLQYFNHGEKYVHENEQTFLGLEERKHWNMKTTDKFF